MQDSWRKPYSPYPEKSHGEFMHKYLRKILMDMRLVMCLITPSPSFLFTFLESLQMEPRCGWEEISSSHVWPTTSEQTKRQFPTTSSGVICCTARVLGNLHMTYLPALRQKTTILRFFHGPSEIPEVGNFPGRQLIIIWGQNVLG